MLRQGKLIVHFLYSRTVPDGIQSDLIILLIFIAAREEISLSMSVTNTLSMSVTNN